MVIGILSLIGSIISLLSTLLGVLVAIASIIVIRVFNKALAEMLKKKK